MYARIDTLYLVRYWLAIFSHIRRLTAIFSYFATYALISKFTPVSYAYKQVYILFYIDKCSYKHHIRYWSASLSRFSVAYKQAHIQFSMRTCSYINHLREGLPISPTPFCAIYVALPISLFVCRADRSVSVLYKGYSRTSNCPYNLYSNLLTPAQPTHRTPYTHSKTHTALQIHRSTTD